MADRIVRVGSVSSINYAAGMITVTYSDLDDSVTDEFPVINLGGIYKMPEIGEDVLVVHMSNGTEAGIVIGSYWTDDDPPEISGAGVYYQKLAENLVAYLLYQNSELRIRAPKIILETDAGEVDVDTLIT